MSAEPGHDAARVSVLMKDVLDARVRDRAARFAVFCMAMTAFLPSVTVKADGLGRTAAAPERDRFLRQSDIYLRALSSYPVTSDAWRDVFLAYKRMFDLHVFGTVQDDKAYVRQHNPLTPNPELSTRWRYN